MSENVECRSDTSYPGEPMAIIWRGKRKSVLQVIASWRTPQEICYRVMTTDMKIYDCLYSELMDHWEIIAI